MSDREGVTGAGAGAGLEIDRFIPYRLAVLSDSVSRALADVYQARFGISIPEWRILAHLGAEEPLSAGDLSRRTHMEKPRVSRTLRRMSGKALIERFADARDQRVAVIRRSGAGRRLYEQVAALALQWEREFLDGLSADEFAALERLLERLGERVQRMRGGGG